MLIKWDVFLPRIPANFQLLSPTFSQSWLQNCTSTIWRSLVTTRVKCERRLQTLFFSADTVVFPACCEATKCLSDDMVLYMVYNIPVVCVLRRTWYRTPKYIVTLFHIVAEMRSSAHSTVQFLETVRIFVPYFSFVSSVLSVLVLYKKFIFQVT